ncbi:MAG: ribosome biogenesis GTPase Der [Candidatus Marinimicrobia bacterium]|nr:ribosome biogenesis GTPase Der [Candidatus Neomarinimicrobiota bacterium]
MAKPTLAIMGRPNVGKSTLFNRLIGRRQAIVDETAGVTRDRLYGSVEWNGHAFQLIDTGGYLADGAEPLEVIIRHQADLAGAEADLVIFLVDRQSGITPDDQAIAERLRRLGKPVLLVVNKVDDRAHEPQVLGFYELGMGVPVAIGATSGRGVGDMLDTALDKLGWTWSDEAAPQRAVGLAIVGAPNVGKSSFLNAVLKEEKAIVTPVPGTTRDSVDSYLNYMKHSLRLIDTAGLRRRAKIDDDIEYYSTVRTLRSIDECQVAIVMIDAERGFNRQDRQIMGRVMDQGKGLVVAVNKWDTVQRDSSTMGQWITDMRSVFKPLAWVPLVFVSVLQNRRVWKVLQLALAVYEETRRNIATSALNQFLEDALRNLSPPATRGKRIQIKYATQVHREPPLFALFCNHPRLIPIPYRRYLENRLRERFGFTGVPIKLSFRRK